jgi:hypothetical protein
MKPIDPPSPKASAGQGPPPPKASARQGPESPTASAPDGSGDGPPSRRPGVGGGATYRHPSDHDQALSSHDPALSYHDGVHDHALDDELHNPDVAHEHMDVNISAIVWSVVVLVLVTLASHIVILVLFGWFEREAEANQGTLSPLARPATEMPTTTTGSPVFSPAANIPGPKLLTDEPMALDKQRSDEAKRLHGYGWADEKTGVAHIPIEEAKKLMLQRGLPVRAEGAVAPNLGTRLPAAGEASGGRVITVPLPEPPAGAPAPPAAAKPHGGH